MKVTKKSNKQERRILTAMVVDDVVLGRIAVKWQDRMFKSTWSNIVAKWCIRHYKKYKKAPKGDIEGIFERWAEVTKDKNAVEMVGKFLNGLSEDYKTLSKEINSQYIIDIAGRYFNQIHIENLLESVQDRIDSGKTDKAHEALVSYNKIDMGVGEGINVLQDEEAIKEAFTSKTKPLITHPGALGEFFGGGFEREGFVSFLGHENVGKSFWLLDTVYRAMLQRKRVVFFEAGDNSRNQVMRRLLARVCYRPIKIGTIEIPTVIKKKQKKEGFKILVKYDDRTYNKKLGWRMAIKKCKRVMRKTVKSKKPFLKLSCHHNSTLHINTIENILQDWNREEEWVPDVIVIDYADILDMTYSGIEGRDRINKTWKELRSLSQKHHCLVVTATQADAKSYDKEGVLGMSNFSDDKRKIAHVTGMVGLNQNSYEKKRGFMKLNWIKKRDEYFNEKRIVYVAGCLSVSNPAVRSCF